MVTKEKKPTTTYILLNLIIFLFLTFPHPSLSLFGAGKIYLQWHGTQPQLVITEPQLIKEVLNNRGSAYPKEEAKGFMKRLFGDGLSVSEGEKWTKMKKLANHAFHAESLKVISYWL